MNNCLWFLSQFGISLEVISAGLIVRFAWHSKQKLKGISTTVNGQDAIEKLLDEIRGQYDKAIILFIILFLGFVFQFIGGFANMDV